MAGNLNSGMCSPLCSDVCAFYLPQGLTPLIVTVIVYGVPSIEVSVFIWVIILLGGHVILKGYQAVYLHDCK